MRALKVSSRPGWLRWRENSRFPPPAGRCGRSRPSIRTSSRALTEAVKRFNAHRSAWAAHDSNPYGVIGIMRYQPRADASQRGDDSGSVASRADLAGHMNADLYPIAERHRAPAWGTSDVGRSPRQRRGPRKRCSLGSTDRSRAGTMQPLAQLEAAPPAKKNRVTYFFRGPNPWSCHSSPRIRLRAAASSCRRGMARFPVFQGTRTSRPRSSISTRTARRPSSALAERSA
jgi:hypothetical protein